MHDILTNIDDLLLESSLLRCKVRVDDLLPEIYEVDDDYDPDEYMDEYHCNDGDCHCYELYETIRIGLNSNSTMYSLAFCRKSNYYTLLYLRELFGEEHLVAVADETKKTVGQLIKYVEQSRDFNKIHEQKIDQLYRNQQVEVRNATQG